MRLFASLLFVVAVCLSAPTWLFAAHRPAAVICASDNFARSGPAMGSDWTMQNWAGDPFGPGNLIVNNNQVQNTSGLTYGVAFFNSVSWGDTQWSQVTLSNLATWGGPAVRVGSGGYYIALVEANAYYVRFRTAVNQVDQYVDIAANVPGTFSPGDVVKLSATGNVLKVYQNGNLIGTYTDTNNSLPSGSPGVFSWNDGSGNSAAVTNWSACSN
jgi:hypothetical protein